MPSIIPWWIWFWGGFWPSFGSEPLELRFPLEASGDIHFQADVARYLVGESAQLVVFVAIPEVGVAAVVAPADSVRYRVTIEPLDRDEKSLARFSTELILPPATVPASGSWTAPRRWIRLRPAWIEGTVGLRVLVEEPDRAKRGLLDQIRKRAWQGEVAARIAAPEERAPAGDALSDFFFVWGPQAQVDAGESSAGLRGVRGRLQPNPYRFYGLHQRVLTVYWERYRRGGPQPGAGRWLEEVSIIALADSTEVYAARDTVLQAAAADWTLRRFELSSLPGGSYRLHVALRPLDDPTQLLDVAAGEFQIVWEARSWVEDESEMSVIGRAILPSDDFEVFRTLDRGGKETFLRELWNRHAPAEPGRVNPLEEKFRARAAYAERNFRGLRPGLRSDRGRVYVRFGPPDEIRTAIDPRGDDMLVNQLPEEMVDAGEDEATSRRRLSRQKLQFDYSAYEVWDYTTRGDPLFPDYLNPGQHLGLKFIFADERGDGDYVLIYTNLSGGMQ